MIVLKKDNIKVLFLKMFVPLTIVLITRVYFFIEHEFDNRLAESYSQEMLKVDIGSNALYSKLSKLTSNLALLSKHHSLQQAINNPNKKNIDDLNSDFLFFLKIQGEYDQIRWIDEYGMEKVRINYNNGSPQVVNTQLQNKSSRYYFKEALALDLGQIYISPFDLNVEQNKIEIPYKPMIRLATPIANLKGEKIGIVILNFYGSEILNVFVEATIKNTLPSMLVNKEGYWLKSSTPSDEWGFMFGRKELTLAQRYPAAWEKISTSDNGQVNLNNEIWTWETVYPLFTDHKTNTGSSKIDSDSASASAYHKQTKNLFWKVVSYRSASLLDLVSSSLLLNFVVTIFVVLSLLSFGLWKLAKAWVLTSEAESNYRTIADFTYNWETWIDPTGSYKYCSPSCENISGYSAQQFLSDSSLFLKITHPDDQEMVALHLSKHTTDEKTCDFSFRIIHKNGDVRWVQHTCIPVFNKEGEYLGRRASNSNITLRVTAEELLLKNEVRLKDMFEHLKSCIAIYSVSSDGAEFTIIDFNRAAEKLEQVERENVIGKNVVEVFPGIIKFGLLDAFKRVFQTGNAELLPISFYEGGKISGWRENYIYKLNNENIVAIYDDVTKNKQEEEKLTFRANHDHLTGLPNRVLLYDRSIHILSSAKRYKKRFALLFLDLDDFKPVNDTFGHDMGDLLLIEVAKRLLSCVRESDTVARVGGDEFIIELSIIESLPDAMSVANKILYSLSLPYELKKEKVNISSSIGIAVYPDHGKDINLLMKNADLAMYQAKNIGKNNIMLFQKEMMDE